MRKLLAVVFILSVTFSGVPTYKTASVDRKHYFLDHKGVEIEVIRDAFGVPHVFAGSDEAAYFGQGYVCAEDRLAQLEKYRLDCTGRMAEFLGPQHISHDERVRLEGYTKDELEEIFKSVPDNMQVAFHAFSDGVNKRLAEIKESPELAFPAMFLQAGYEPENWSVLDSVAIGVQFARRFGESGELDMHISRLHSGMVLQHGREEADGILSDIIWLNDSRAPNTVQDQDARTVPLGLCREEFVKPTTPPPFESRDAAPVPAGEGSEDYWMMADPKIFTADYASRPQTSKSEPEMEYERIHDLIDETCRQHDEFYANLYAEELPVKLGSNAWAITGEKSESGRAMLFGGPMMGFRVPQIAYEIHLNTPSQNVMGMTFAGVPGVLIGTNEKVAWTTTTGMGDCFDHFLETLHPENDRKYMFDGEWRDMQVLRDTIKVRGEQPREFTWTRTVHGPVMSVDEGKAISASRTYWKKEIGAFVAIFKMNRASNVREFEEACSFIETSHNFFCATASGDIGFWWCGKFPVRHPAQDHRFITNGDGSREWQGIVPFEQLPHIVNPSHGYVGNWNNKPAKNWNLLMMGEMFWGNDIYEILSAPHKISHNEFREVAHSAGTDIFYADYLKPYLLSACEEKLGDLGSKHHELLQAVRDWDNHEREGSIGTRVFLAWYESLKDWMFKDRIPGEVLGEMRSSISSLILHSLDGDNSGVPCYVDWFRGERPANVLRAIFVKVVDEMLASGKPLEHEMDRIGFNPLPSIPETRRGTYMQIIELGENYLQGENCLPPGQKENSESLHFGDQREMFARWEYKDMVLDYGTICRMTGVEPNDARAASLREAPVSGSVGSR
ncbi:MAG: penicillin acylase family protein [Planctomycetes bacterium]|nr:penicillin acylase family protein [Planctomycetota bacterium]